MRTVDFGRSFVTWRVDLLKKPQTTATHRLPTTLNNARVPLDCRCEITERRTRQAYEYVLGAACKSERVGVERDIWVQPNADYIPIRSRDQFLTLKNFGRVGAQVMLYPPSLGVQPERNVGKNADAFDSVKIDVQFCDAELLATPERIVAAVLANEPLVGRTEIQNERYVALIEYPIKTMNASERDNVYQPDTGPVILPDLSREPADLIAGFELAFLAFNCPDWVEFLVRVPTPMAEGISVYHYSQSVRLDSTNQIVRPK